MDKNRDPRIIIYGAGAIGGALGGHLALAGAEVALIGRAGHINKIRDHGLRFITPSGTHILKLRAFTSPAEIDFKSDDIVFLTMKSQNTEAALCDLQNIVKDIPIFCFQNGVRNEEIAAKYFPRVYAVMVRIGGEYVTDGEITVRRDPPGWLVMSRYPDGIDALVESVSGIVRQAGFHVLIRPNAMPYKWGKLMSNLANAIGAITNAKWNETRPIMQAAQEEARNILNLAGIHWISQEDLRKEWPDLDSPPKRSLTTESQSSTWQSLARRQGTVETEFLNGEIVRLAKRLGKSASINEGLVRITEEMAAKRESPGKHTAKELTQMLGIG